MTVSLLESTAITYLEEKLVGEQVHGKLLVAEGVDAGSPTT